VTALVLESVPLGFQWPTLDPFLFCVHHEDRYPAGNGRYGPAASLEGRNLGQDFEPRDGWRMYHGETVPGFPQHPHRGFETVTLVRDGLIDHSDSLGATARFGHGDAQWLTAGAGVVHSEMFPLVDTKGPNRAELFQIWLNLPRAEKFAPPHFTMFWNEDIPRVTETDAEGRKSEVAIIAGAFPGATPLPPPPHSYAARAESDLAIWTVRMEAGAKLTLPAASHARTVRMLYFFAGQFLRAGELEATEHRGLLVRADVAADLEAGPDGAEILVLQGRPLEEPVAHHGPFVMNTREELQQAFLEYQRTQFGGWPWPSDDPVHGDQGRFARYPDGRVEHPPAADKA
jgi:redox-sensitive bicupin YhaK (pirin superfamily)